MINKIKFQLSRKPKLHFLHIGKTGGSAVKASIKPYVLSGKYKIVLHDHEMSLLELKQGEKVFFFLRDPIARFISGFYSRQRRGLPRYDSKWSEGEEKAFTHFTTPNQLACALAEEKGENYQHAMEAMHAIKHLNHYSYWFKNKEYIELRKADILFVGFQESLDEDFERLKIILDLPKNLNLPKDEVGAHRNPQNIDKHIDEYALEKLKNWYQEDINFYNHCKMFNKHN